MSIIGSNILAGASGQAGAAGGYQISRSVRFNSSDSAYLSRTPASAGNRKTWTWAGWVKRNRLTGTQGIFEAYVNGSASFFIGFRTTTDDLAISATAGVSPSWGTAAKFRDPSAWYHIVAVVDTTSSTSTISNVSTDRIRLYVNGAQQTLSSGSVPSQNSDLQVNDTIPHHLGRFQAGGFYSNLQLADVHFIDGQALDPTSFGEFDTNNVWQPKAFSGGSYGTNGFRLPFSDNSTAAALGTDTSSNGNTWTVNNISVTAGVGNDSLVDSPTNGSQTDTGVGGEVVGNYATLNPLNTTGGTLSNGNLDYAMTNTRCVSNFAMTSQKWHCEVTVASDIGATSEYSIGVSGAGFYQPNGVASGTASVMYYAFNGNKYVDGSPSAYGASFGSTDVIGVALDADAGTVTFYKNNSSQGAITLPSSSSGWVLNIQATAGATNATFNTNFGQRQWAYAAPAGFKALCTTNLPEPTIADGSTVMDVKTWTGDGTTGTGSITGFAFSPDFVWAKTRSAANSHLLYDTVRGASTSGSSKALVSNASIAEGSSNDDTTYGYLSSFNSDGFSYFGGSSPVYFSQNGASFVAWAWDAGSSTVTNTAGSISSQVRANASAGFSVVTWTGNGTQGATIGHGLGVLPRFLIFKRRDDGTAASAWWTYHASVVSPNANWWRNYSSLNSTGAFADWGGDSGLAADPTSTLITVGNYSGLNSNGGTYVCYAFAPVAGYSAMGSYVGNGSSDGVFVYTGFRSRWIMFKRSDSTSDWFIFDTSRPGYNLINLYLMPNNSSAENSDAALDIVSNGFKWRSSAASINGSGATIIYYAVAENPFQYARAR